MFRWVILLHLHRNQSGFQDGIGQFGFWVAQVFAWFLPLVLRAPQQQGGMVSKLSWRVPMVRMVRGSFTHL